MPSKVSNGANTENVTAQRGIIDKPKGNGLFLFFAVPVGTIVAPL